jgi:hypothetical protein
MKLLLLALFLCLGNTGTECNRKHHAKETAEQASAILPILLIAY